MKLSIVGTGQIVQTLLPHLRKWGWEPAAICATERSAGTARELAERYGCPAVYTDDTAMLEHSLRVSEVQTEARLSTGIRFPADDAGEKTQCYNN